MPDERIRIAEISKNYPDEGLATEGVPLASLFERVILHNETLGFVLDQFSLHRLVTPGGFLNETIIAVFRRAQ